MDKGAVDKKFKRSNPGIQVKIKLLQEDASNCLLLLPNRA